MTEIRPVFYVSDGTGITAETIGHSLLTQFSGLRFATDRLPFVDTAEKARAAAEEIRKAGEEHGLRPVVVNSCVDPQLNALLAESGALMLDVFAPFIAPLEELLGRQRELHVGMASDYSDADLVLVGVSRAGKTPTCVYLALHHGVRAANYPLTEEDLESVDLPKRLRPYRNKLFGLTIDPQRLHEIRQERRPDSRYAQLETCKREVAAAEALLQTQGIQTLSTTHASIEEIASRVLEVLGLNREMF